MASTLRPISLGPPHLPDWSWGSTKVHTGWFWEARLASSGDKLGHADN